MLFFLSLQLFYASILFQLFFLSLQSAPVGLDGAKALGRFDLAVDNELPDASRLCLHLRHQHVRRLVLPQPVHLACGDRNEVFSSCEKCDSCKVSESASALSTCDASCPHSQGTYCAGAAVVVQAFVSLCHAA